jgi:hypothetical protein
MFKHLHLIVTLILAISISIYQSIYHDMTLLIFIFPLIINLINFFVSLFLSKYNLVLASALMLVLTFISYRYWGIIFSKLNEFENVPVIDNLIYNFSSNFSSFYGFINFWIYLYPNKIKSKIN